jgi:hypothetical protein
MLLSQQAREKDLVAERDHYKSEAERLEERLFDLRNNSVKRDVLAEVRAALRTPEGEDIVKHAQDVSVTMAVSNQVREAVNAPEGMVISTVKQVVRERDDLKEKLKVFISGEGWLVPFRDGARRMNPNQIVCDLAEVTGVVEYLRRINKSNDYAIKKLTEERDTADRLATEYHKRCDRLEEQLHSLRAAHAWFRSACTDDGRIRIRCKTDGWEKDLVIPFHTPPYTYRLPAPLGLAVDVARDTGRASNYVDFRRTLEVDDGHVVYER